MRESKGCKEIKGSPTGLFSLKMFRLNTKSVRAETTSCLFRSSQCLASDDTQVQLTCECLIDEIHKYASFQTTANNEKSSVSICSFLQMLIVHLLCDWSLLLPLNITQ